MKTFLGILTCSLCFINLLNGQTLFGIAPSMYANISFFDQNIYPTFGIQASIDKTINNKTSLRIAGLIHYGKHQNIINKSIVQKDFLLGAQIEYRIYFKDRFNGIYLGLGSNLNYLKSQNYVSLEQKPQDPNHGSMEWSAGFSFGHYVPMRRVSFLNPNIFIGYCLGEYNIYPMNINFGLNIGFHQLNKSNEIQD